MKVKILELSGTAKNKNTTIEINDISEAKNLLLVNNLLCAKYLKFMHLLII